MSRLMKRNIFIASSDEALPIARAVKTNFDKEADVDIWNENVFKLNKSYLDTLLNRASYYDFAIAVFAKDDIARVRKKSLKVTRDNVIFEFGLFLGRLGPHRTFLIAERGVDLFSDWSGISTAKFERRDNMVAAVGTACEQIREGMERAGRIRQFSMLPSTSLAIGYYSNFLKRVFDAFAHIKEFKIIHETDSNGKPVREETFPLDQSRERPVVHVMVPERLADLEPELLRDRTKKYKQIVVSLEVRSFPFYISGEVEKEGGKITLFDIPTTLLSSRRAIREIFDKDFLAEGNTERHLESREIANFERTLRLMVPDLIERDYFRFSVLK
jgi:hypothetical protein